MHCSLNVKLGFIYFTLVSHGSTAPSGPGTPRYEASRLHTITPHHTTIDMTTPDEWSVRCRDLYLKTHNIIKKKTFMTPAGFQPANPASDGPQINTLPRAASRIGSYSLPKLSAELNDTSVRLVCLCSRESGRLIDGVDDQKVDSWRKKNSRHSTEPTSPSVQRILGSLCGVQVIEARSWPFTSIWWRNFWSKTWH